MLECIVTAGTIWLYGVGAWGGTFVINADNINKIYVGSAAQVHIETTNGSTTKLPAETITVGDVYNVIKDCNES